MKENKGLIIKIVLAAIIIISIISIIALSSKKAKTIGSFETELSL